MHSDFTFEPTDSTKLKNAPQLFTRIKTVGSAIAASALNSFAALASNTGEHLPGLAHGRLHLPLSVLFSHNNIREDVRAPFPSQMITLERTAGDDRDMGLLIYTDRSMLLFVEEPDFEGRLNGPVMRILPIVFKFTSSLSIAATNDFYKMTVKTIDGRARLHMQFVDKGAPASKPFDFIDGEPQSYSGSTNRLFIIDTLDAMIRAWIAEADQAPLIFPGTPEARKGIFGKDAPAPSPEFEGQAYAWPAAFPSLNCSKDQLARARDFIDLACTHLVAQHENQIADFTCDIVTGIPEQTGRCARITTKITARSTDSTQGAKKFSKWLEEELQHLLCHPSAPDMLFDIAGQGLTTARRNPDQTILAPYDLHLGKLPDYQNRHKRLKAHALFATKERQTGS